jgi:hypothetical protein
MNILYYIMSKCCKKAKQTKKMCKNSVSINIGNNAYCWIHANQLNINPSKSVILIQRYYRGYKCRKKLKNLFYNLPRELQILVISHMHMELKYKNYIASIANIVNNKIENFENMLKFVINYTNLHGWDAHTFNIQEKLLWVIKNTYSAYISNNQCIVKFGERELKNLRYLYFAGFDVRETYSEILLDYDNSNNVVRFRPLIDDIKNIFARFLCIFERLNNLQFTQNGFL